MSLAVVTGHRTGEEVVNYVCRLAELGAEYLEGLIDGRQPSLRQTQSFTEVESPVVGRATHVSDHSPTE